jgi:transposase
MMGERSAVQEELFYGFSLEQHVPADHLLRSIDRFVDLSGIRQLLAPCYSAIGRPSIDPELLIRMLIVGYCFGIRSERRLCEEVHLNLAYRWFCRLGLYGDVPDHSTFSKTRHGRFREADLLRELSKPWFAVAWRKALLAAKALLSMPVRSSPMPTGNAISVRTKSLSRRPAGRWRNIWRFWMMRLLAPPRPSSRNPCLPVDPAARWTAEKGGAAIYAYYANYLIDVDHAVIVDVEASTAIRQAEVTAAKRVIERTQDRFGLWAERLMADTAYGSGPMLDWLVHERGIEPHIPVFDKSKRTDGTYPRDDFVYDHNRDLYRCPAGKDLRHGRRTYKVPRSGVTKEGLMIYRASKSDCCICPLKPRCTPKEPMRKIKRWKAGAARFLAAFAEYEMAHRGRPHLAAAEGKHGAKVEAQADRRLAGGAAGGGSGRATPARSHLGPAASGARSNARLKTAYLALERC